MTVIIHDLENSDLKALFPQVDASAYFISDENPIQSCIGCFGCWIKTPGKCVLKDGYNNMGAILSRADQLILISKCYYGGYSPYVKNVLDRCIPYLLPFFKTKKSETHHQRRYKNSFSITAHFYGDSITSQEMDIAQKLVKANATNFYAKSSEVFFHKAPGQLKGVPMS